MTDRPSHTRVWLALLAGVALLGLGVWLVFATLPQWLTRPEGGATSPTPAEATSDTRRINATLFYVAADGRSLQPVGREVRYAPTPSGLARNIVEAQIAPAPAGQHSPIPAGTTVRAVYLTPRGEAYVDLGPEIAAGHPGGSLNEALTVYALVHALTVNLPDVATVQILIDGREVDSLSGHIDIRHPLGRSLRWVQRGQ